MRPFVPLLALALLVTAATAQNYDFSPVDQVINGAVARQEIPGAVLIVGFGGKAVYRKAYGSRSVEPTQEAMTTDTVFDIASLTKLFTACAVMELVQKGKVRLNDPVAKYLPEFSQNGKQEITVRMLLTHFSGLPPDLDLSEPWKGKDAGFRRAMAVQPVAAPGARFLYSDINFEVLGFLVEFVNGEPLERSIERVVLQPLGMQHTRFLPPDAWTAKIAPTARDESGAMLRGIVHDPTARRMGGVAGHAGLFSTADELARFAQAFLDQNGLLTPLIIEKMTTPQQPAWSMDLRGLGWDIASPLANVRGDVLPARSFGHSGYTGTSIWIDPVSSTYIVLLTNSVHPQDASDAWPRVSLRGKVANAVVSALAPEIDRKIQRARANLTSYTETMAMVGVPAARNGNVLTGIDVLEKEAFASLRGRKIGLLTNQTGLSRHGWRTIDVLAHAPVVQLVRLYSVEHGLAGKQDSLTVSEQADQTTGIPVVNVYGASADSRAPSAEQLRGIDTLVIDLQDVGVRFYTYAASMAAFLQASANNNIEVVVLDRPNPLNGNDVQGPITDAPDLWPNFPLPLPLRHGMTMGELAQMFNTERKLGADLKVIAMQGWSRGDWFDSTGLLWVDPSPNLRSLNAATLYPGVAMLEAQGSNLSVGRGTDAPFEMIGAPWIHSESATRLAGYLNEREVPGVRFVARMFTPKENLFARESCGGVGLVVTNRAVLDAGLLGAELTSALLKLFPNDFHSEANRKLVGDGQVLKQLQAGRDPKAVAIEWQDALEAFRKQREKYLLY